MKICNKGIGWAGVDWMDVVQEKDNGQAFVCTVMNLHVSYKAEECLATYSLVMSGNPCHEWLQNSQKNEGFFLHMPLNTWR